MNSTGNTADIHNFDEIATTDRPMLLRSSTSEVVISVTCDQGKVSPFSSLFSFSTITDKFHNLGPAFDLANDKHKNSSSSDNTITDDEFRKLKETMRSTGMQTTNGVRHMLFCPSLPL